MAINFSIRGKRFAFGAFGALLSALMLLSACDDTQSPTGPNNNGSDYRNLGGQNGGNLPSNEGPDNTNLGPVIPPLPGKTNPFDFIEVIVRTDPAEPQNERFLEDWRFEIFNIDDQARQLSQIFFGETDLTGGARLGLPSYMFALPLVIRAYNEVYPPTHDRDDFRHHCTAEDAACIANEEANYHEKNGFGECKQFEVFVPANCNDRAVWMVGPFEDSLWDFYKEAARRRAESWEPSQVDCGTWLSHMQLLLGSDRIVDELNDISNTIDQRFDREVLFDALQENQEALVPTRPPICMAERRHNGGGLERGDIIEEDDDDNDSTIKLDDFNRHVVEDEDDEENLDLADRDPIYITKDGIPKKICGVTISRHHREEGNETIANSDDDDSPGELDVNGTKFTSLTNYWLDEEDFIGVVSDHPELDPLLDVTIFNVRQTNGREFDDLKYDDACSLTTLVEFTNNDDDEQDVQADSGFTFYNLFGHEEAEVYLTSDGDAVVDDNDTWVIFMTEDEHVENGEDHGKKVISVELPGHRAEDFRDVLHLKYDEESEELFVGLRADFELNEEEVDGERAFMGFTITAWDGSTEDGREAIRDNIANCYDASDVWARQFFVTENFQSRKDECCFDDECIIDDVIGPLLAAEYAVRSQCFSNSRSQQRWQTDDVGFWDMNTHHGVAPNLVVNAGWLAPFLDFEIYIQKFDEAVFKGPRTVTTTDEVGQLMLALPTIVEGDRILIKSEDSCCDDYDLVIPCVPEFTGFAGAPGIPYIPQAIGPMPAALPTAPATP